MNDSRMVAVANELTNARGGHLGVFLGEIHRHLAHKDIIALATATEDVLLGDIIMVAHLLKDIIHGEGMIVNLHRTLDDTLGKTHINIAVIHN